MSEFLIHRKMYRSFPRFVPKPISYKNGYMTVMNCGISLKKWISEKKPSDFVIFQIIRNVKIILKKIYAKFPRFRHMDLHLGNLLINKGKIYIIDFGMSKFTSGKDGYDIHFFLNSLRHQLLKNPQKNPKALRYLNKVLIPGLRGSTGKYVKNFRLRNDSAASIALKLLRIKP